MTGPRLIHRIVGTQHVYTSPDVPELHVSHSDKAVALASVPSALELLARMKARIAARKAGGEPQKF